MRWWICRVEGVSRTKNIFLPLLLPLHLHTQFPISHFKDEDISSHHIDIFVAVVIWYAVASTFTISRLFLKKEKRKNEKFLRKMKIDDLLAKDQTNFLLTREENRPFPPDEKSSLTKFYSICKIKMRKIFVCLSSTSPPSESENFCERRTIMIRIFLCDFSF